VLQTQAYVLATILAGATIALVLLVDRVGDTVGPGTRAERGRR
jgi:hypothetical protein